MSDDIREHMAVLASDGTPIGTVDRVEGGLIKLTRQDNPFGEAGRHGYVPLSWVAAVDGTGVRLSLTPSEAEETIEQSPRGE